VPTPETVPNPAPELVPSPDIEPIPQPIPSPDAVPTPETVPNPAPELAPSPDIGIIPEPSVIPSPYIEPSPEEPIPPTYVVTDNFVSKVIKHICSSMFDILVEICPFGYQQNLPIYEASCGYDGSALLSYRFDQLKIDASIITNPKAFFTNAAQLAETVFDESTYRYMITSVHAGIHDSFSLAANISDVNEFFISLPGCSSYCKFPGASCSSAGDCQLSLTLAQMIALTASASTIYMNVMFLIICLLTLSIWN